MTAAAWIILAWGVANGVCCYWVGRCTGWLRCSDEQTKPAHDGWRDAMDGWGATIAEFQGVNEDHYSRGYAHGLRDVSYPKATDAPEATP